MSKRVAERELTDRNWDQEDEEEEAGEFEKANEDTLKKRHVLKARRRGPTSSNGASSFSGFSGFKGFQPAQTSTPFSFNTRSMTNGKADVQMSETPSIPKFEQSPKLVQSPKTNGKETGTVDKKQNSLGVGKDDSVKKEKQAQYVQNLKNLNESVLSWIKQHVEKNPYCILTPIFSDYEKHLKDIEKDAEMPDGKTETDLKANFQNKEKDPQSSSTSGSTSTSSLPMMFKPAGGSLSGDTCLVSNKAESEKSVACQSSKPATGASKTSASESSASSNSNSLAAMFKPPTGSWSCDTCLISNKADSSKCIACQTPKPSASAKTAPAQSETSASSSSSVMDKFKKPSGSWKCDICLVSNPGDKEACLACQTAKPGSSKSADKPTSGFSIGQNAFSSSSPFTFKSNGTTTASATFTFGSASSSSFSSTSGTNKFSFGAVTATESTGKFTFGTATNSKPFTFGTSSTSADTKSDSAVSKPAFSFGTNTTTTSSKTFSFGSSSISAGNTSASEGTKTSPSGKSFSFGSTSVSTVDPKTFSFGLAKPAENSGKDDSSSTSENTDNDKNLDASEDKKSNTVSVTSAGFFGFNFKPGNNVFGNSGTGSGTTGFSFGANSSVQPSSTSNSTEEEEYVPPQVESVEVKEEGALYTIKCKLFYQNSGAWEDRGLGYLHLKKSNEKLQLLVRTDTTLGNILLNILVPVGMPVNRQGKNNVSLIAVPNPPIKGVDESKPVPWLIRVKTGQDADQLVEKIEELRKN